MIANMQTTTPSSFSRSRASSGSRSPLSLDLSNLPPLVEPSPPSNTLIITNLVDPNIFQLSILTEIRETIDQHAKVHTWAPLKSFSRIVISFFEIESAQHIRQILDGEQLMGCRVRVYFGLNTPLHPTDQHLALPQSDRLFFISPPPSPPMGWEMRAEEAPNKLVHAEDLAVALAKLHANSRHDAHSPVSDFGTITRRRTGSTTLVYHPEDHGDSPRLPAISVEDTTDSSGSAIPMDVMEDVEGPIASQKAQGKMVSTSRPPVEFMY